MESINLMTFMRSLRFSCLLFFLVLATLICMLMNISMVQSVSRCQLDKNSRLLLQSINPMLRKLGVELLKTKGTIVSILLVIQAQCC